MMGSLSSGTATCSGVYRWQLAKHTHVRGRRLNPEGQLRDFVSNPARVFGLYRLLASSRAELLCVRRFCWMSDDALFAGAAFLWFESPRPIERRTLALVLERFFRNRGMLAEQLVCQGRHLCPPSLLVMAAIDRERLVYHTKPPGTLPSALGRTVRMPCLSQMFATPRDAAELSRHDCRQRSEDTQRWIST